MGLWQFFFADDNVTEPTVNTVPGGTNTGNPTSTSKPTVIHRTDANGSSRTVINLEGGNYNEVVRGDYIQGDVVNINIE